MLRICAALIAAALVPAMAGPAAMASSKELKPKFGDIGGVYYTDVAEDREACRQAIKNKIALCRQNTNFVSNTLDRKYPGCLPIFRGQSQVCADHFRSEAYKCQGAGSVRIADFTGFACTVTATVVEEGGEPERGKPERGTGSRDPARQGRGAAAGLSPKCAGMGKGAKCWNELTNKPGCYIFDPYFNPPETATWSGACSGGVAVGRGTAGWRTSRSSGDATGTLVRGKRHGRWVVRFANGTINEGPYVDGKPHGRWVLRLASGTVFEGPYVDGKAHGRWVERFASGNVHEGPYVDGKRHGRWIIRYADGSVFEGPYVDGKEHGRWVERYANGKCSALRYNRGKSVSVKRC